MPACVGYKSLYSLTLYNQLNPQVLLIACWDNKSSQVITVGMTNASRASEYITSVLGYQ